MDAKTKQWFAFRNATEDEVEVYLYEEIGFWGVTSKAFVEELNQHKGKHIHLRIDSPGGEVHAGNAIFNALRRHKGGVTVHIDGMAASMASVIAMAGSPICIADNAFLFVHNPWTMLAGDSGEMRKTAEQLDVIGNVLVGMYAQRTKLPIEEIQQMMDEETLLSATDAVALGFADMIEDGVPIAASMTPEKAKARFDKFARSMEKNLQVRPYDQPADEPAETVEAPAVETPAEEIEAPAIETAEGDLPAVPPAEDKAPVAKADIESVLGKVQNLTAENSLLRTEVQALREDRDNLQAEVKALHSEFTRVGELLANLEKSKGLASAEVQPEIVRESNTLTRAEFDSLAHDKRAEFFRNGGKIIAG
jgi:ATP-dependent protease ClpP protease subunit